MIVYTDDINFAAKFLPEKITWEEESKSSFGNSIRSLSQILFNKINLYSANLKSEIYWQYLFIVKHALKSQFDILSDFNKYENHLTDSILCLAGSGDNFHGYRNRAWAALPGNLHLSVFRSPNMPVEFFHVGFTILSVVSVIQTIDSIPELKNKAGIKWVNDIFIKDSKVSGVIAQTQSIGNIVSGIVLGIGLNIETTPSIKFTDFVPKTTCLYEYTTNKEKSNLHFIFNKLIYFLYKNYQILLNGGYRKLLDFYRERSLIIGKKVIIYSDPVDGENVKIAEGKVLSIGDNLELYLEKIKEPVNKGRLVMPGNQK